jgi:three-Cys-motif partner protein
VAGNFFERPQAAARLKHQLLGRYLRVFVQKVGSTSAGKRVVFLDGYAGPGVYGDETPGSPALALDVAALVATTDNLVGYVVEANKAHYQRLKALVEDRRPDWFVYHGHVEDHLDDILAKAGKLPLFAFLDPFGLAVPLDTITAKLLSRSGRWSAGSPPRAATEVLLNFSLSGLRRNAGHLDSQATDPRYLAARTTILERVDRTLGGPWWRSIWQGRPPGDREDAILDGYLRRVAGTTGVWQVTAVPVADRWQGPPVYYLVHLTQHPHGVWHFSEALSNAMESYRLFCLEQAGQLDLEPLAQREAMWEAHITANIERLLANGHFVIGDRAVEVYGDALGLAREKHIRAAVKTLHDRTVTSCDGKGPVRTMRVTPSSRRLSRQGVSSGAKGAR